MLTVLVPQEYGDVALACSLLPCEVELYEAGSDPVRASTTIVRSLQGRPPTDTAVVLPPDVTPNVAATLQKLRYRVVQLDASGQIDPAQLAQQLGLDAPANLQGTPATAPPASPGPTSVQTPDVGDTPQEASDVPEQPLWGLSVVPEPAADDLDTEAPAAAFAPTSNNGTHPQAVSPWEPDTQGAAVATQAPPWATATPAAPAYDPSPAPSSPAMASAPEPKLPWETAVPDTQAAPAAAPTWATPSAQPVAPPQDVTDAPKLPWEMAVPQPQPSPAAPAWATPDTPTASSDPAAPWSMPDQAQLAHDPGQAITAPQPDAAWPAAPAPQPDAPPWAGAPTPTHLDAGTGPQAAASQPVLGPDYGAWAQPGTTAGAPGAPASPDASAQQPGISAPAPTAAPLDMPPPWAQPAPAQTASAAPAAPLPGDTPVRPPWESEAPAPAAPTARPAWEHPGVVEMSGPIGGGHLPAAQVFAIIAPKGGVGKSTLSIYLAALTAQVLTPQGKRVLLVDANFQQADVRKYLQLPDSLPTIAHLTPFMGNPQQLQAQLRRIIYHDEATGLDILLGPADIRTADPSVLNPLYEQCVPMAAGQYDYVIVDTPVAEHFHRTFERVILPLANQLVCIVNTSAVAYTNVLSYLSLKVAPVGAGGSGIDPHRINIVANGVPLSGADRQAQDVLASYKNNLAARWTWLGEIPLDPAWTEAGNRGRIPDPNCPASRALLDVAWTLMGEPALHPAERPESATAQRRPWRRKK